MSLQDHYARRQDYRAGELCEAEWDQAEERTSPGWILPLSLLAWVPVIVAGWLIF